MVEVRGQFTGHYLSASALWCNHTGVPLSYNALLHSVSSDILCALLYCARLPTTAPVSCQERNLKGSSRTIATDKSAIHFIT